jgi:hypothetical protein
MPEKTVCVVARGAAVPSFVGSTRDADNRELRKKRPPTEVEQRAGKGWRHKLKFMGDDFEMEARFEPDRHSEGRPVTGHDPSPSVRGHEYWF